MDHRVDLVATLLIWLQQHAVCCPNQSLSCIDRIEDCHADSIRVGIDGVVASSWLKRGRMRGLLPAEAKPSLQLYLSRSL